MIKMNRKIKIFLGGYVNCTNAQNLNCRSLVKYLDKSKFDCAVMTIFSGDLPLENDLKGVKFFKCYRPFRIWKYIVYLRGILWCDVAYLPKGELWNFCAKCLKCLKKKSFLTVEGVIEGSNLEKSIAFFASKENIVSAYNYTTKTYSITALKKKKNKSLLNIKSDGVLYLGIDRSLFNITKHKHEQLKNIAFIGNNIRYKGIDDYFAVAEKFPDIKFHIIGGGLGYDVESEIKKRGLKNCVYHGLLNHNELYEVLKEIDLHIFPSRSEGFPKVTLETASMGVPSIVYGDYGATEWITTGKDGYVVTKKEEIFTIIGDINDNPEKLNELSYNAIELAKRFDWKILVKDWEKVIEDIYKGK